MSRAYYRGMELVVYGFDGIMADCFIKELERRQRLLIIDIELEAIV